MHAYLHIWKTVGQVSRMLSACCLGAYTGLPEPHGHLVLGAGVDLGEAAGKT
jgi:hypothetical protein